ncbi:hypothetical protein KDH_66270 [Dictyobacter sp. S3.2.2.5]|uniref:Transposase IS204/IS1001/IS1096/IS1165 DDE domain-containing protein n=1 Tax=Dictyobacter halimunensis TaxID=3026934 RepID=A0ABQ6G1S4_9CHLR|nr:hypothetical protein KDH_66270 [Dictyobacter sp. S3.2.2.5]
MFLLYLLYRGSEGVGWRRVGAGRKKKDAFATEWLGCVSQGAVEGYAHWLKLIKRQAYGKASFQTLRKRALCCA